MADEFKHLSAGTSLTQGEYEAVGGHVFACQAAGDILYASSSSQLSRIGKGTNGEILQQASCKPDWTDSPSLNALTVDDVNINGKVVTLTGSACDTIVMTAAANGAFSLVTTDTAAAAANIQITADGTVDIDSAGVLTLDSGAAINIEPAACSAILLDGTISIDGAAITGATSILATDIKIGEDDETKVDFADANIINLHANNIKALSVHNTSSKGELRFYEGANYVGFAAPALSADQVWTLPTADGSSGQALVTDSCGVLSWATAGGGPCVANGADNRVATFSGACALNGEANLTFNGTVLDLVDASCRQIHIPSGTVAKPGIAFGADSCDNTGFYRPAENVIGAAVGCNAVVRIDRGEGCGSARIVVGDSANANNGGGMTLNQAATDNEILALKSSDIAHGVTGHTETDTYFMMKKLVAAGGGINMRAYADGGCAKAFMVNGITCGAGDTTKGTSGAGVVHTVSARKCGTGTGEGFSSSANLFAVAVDGSTQFIVDKEGDVHYNGSTSAGAWDVYCDVELLTATRAIGMPDGSDFKNRFGGFISEYSCILEKTGVVHLNRDTDSVPFVSSKALNGLLIDSVRQLHGRIETLETQLTALQGGK